MVLTQGRGSRLVVNLIAKVVVRNFPDAKVLPFGSFETKFYSPSGKRSLIFTFHGTGINYSKSSALMT
jgi:non-canonical poly(A) RNA polymerase PAPD5/7